VVLELGMVEVLVLAAAFLSVVVVWAALSFETHWKVHQKCS
jgi:hypothetical protein